LLIENSVEILKLLKSLAIILRELKDASQLDSIFLSFGGDFLVATKRRVKNLQHHHNPDIRRVSTIIERQLELSMV